MKRRLIIGLLCSLLCVLCGVLGTPAQAADPGGDLGHDMSWSLSRETGTLTIDCAGWDRMPTFATAEAVPWKEYCTNITTVKFVEADTLENLSYYAFSGCTSLTSIDLPDSLETIEQYVFSGCTSLKNIDLPNGVDTIGRYAFNSCTSLMNIDVPDSITSIDTGAFYGCSSLTSIDLPSGVTSIGNSVFNGCESLTSIDLPSGVTSIGNSAFYGCSGLTSIELPDGVTSIGNSAFYGCTGLADINLPEQLKRIGSQAFRDCTGLQSVTVPDSVTSIGYMAFYNCSSLTSVTLPTNADFTEIGSSTFSGCSSLMSITIPENVTTIGNNAFNSCTALCSITIPSSVTNLGYGAFYGCSALTSVILWPEVAPTVAVNDALPLFGGCDALATVAILDGATGYTVENGWPVDVINYSITVKPVEHGTINVKPTSAKAGSKVTLTVTPVPDEGYTLQKLEVTANTPDKDGNKKTLEVTDNFFTMPGDTVTITPIFAPASYDVTLNADGGTIVEGDVESYVYGVGATLPTKVTKKGYTFAGWYSDKDFGGTPVKEIITTDFGDKTYYAKWLSADASVATVTVQDQPASLSSDGTYVVTLPAGSTLPTADKIAIAPTHDGATVSTPTTTDNGASWHFTVTAEDNQTTASYILRVTVEEPDPEEPDTDPDDPSTGPDDPAVDDPSDKPSTPVTPSEPDPEIEVTEPAHGDVEISPSKPEAGETVTITPTPDDGYEVEDVIVTDEDGERVPVTENPDGSWSYEQPESDVTIEVIFGEIAPEPTPDVSEIFLDVDPDAWYKDAVQFVYDNGLMTGTSATEFAPDVTTTRAMIVGILARLEGVMSASDAGFSDVDDEWFATAVNWAASVGVVNGFEDNTFRPNDAITREQLAAILCNYAAWKGEDVSARADLSAYSDAAAISSWATDVMRWAVAENLVNGVTDDMLQPQGAATRAQVAAILERFLTR